MKQPISSLSLKGEALLNSPRFNKGTAFTKEERERYGLRGLLPAGVSTQAQQIHRSLENLRRKSNDIERYIFLMALLERNEQLFYQLISDHIEELMPIIYTPTVGQACQEFAHIFRHSRGLYITPKDRGSIESLLGNWPESDVCLIVVTDGQRILGLGDLGANGIGIAIGKLALYSVCAGIPPHQCMPVMLDVGTDNEALRQEPLYLGERGARLRGEAYFSLVDEFIVAVKNIYPDALIQFEDFLSPNAYSLLDTYRDNARCFNDDIQGTAAMALAGVLASCKITGVAFDQLRIMFLGAGSAATGIGNLIQAALEQFGLTTIQAREQLWFVDQFGLLVKNREDLAPYNRQYAKDALQVDFVTAISKVKPHVLIGATGTAGTFTQEVIELMSKLNERPVIFALSNPTSKTECTAKHAYQWSKGQAIFASGSPFEAVTITNKTFHPSQGNNAYVFPGVGLGVLACHATHVSDEMFLAAAEALANSVTRNDLQRGAVYPSLVNIREISLKIATAVAQVAYRQGLAVKPQPDNIEDMIRRLMYDPSY